MGLLKWIVLINTFSNYCNLIAKSIINNGFSDKVTIEKFEKAREKFYSMIKDCLLDETGLIRRVSNLQKIIDRERERDINGYHDEI